MHFTRFEDGEGRCDHAIVNPELHSFHITNIFLSTQNFARILQEFLRDLFAYKMNGCS